jgi:hypothetical protein
MSITQICLRQLTYTPPPLASLGLDVSGALSALVQRTLSKDPAQRGSMEDFADDLAEELHRIQAPRRAAALALPVPPRIDGQARTEPNLAAVSDRPPTSGPAAPVAQRGGELGGGEANRGTVLPPEGPPQGGAPGGDGDGASPAAPSASAAQVAAGPVGAAEVPRTVRSASATVALSARAPVPSPAHAAAPVALEVVAVEAPAERGSTANPVARPTAASAAPRRRLGVGAVLGVGVGLLVVGLGVVGWWAAGRGRSAAAGATGSASASATVTATATAPRPAVTAATGATATASAVRARPGASAAPKAGPPRRGR